MFLMLLSSDLTKTVQRFSLLMLIGMTGWMSSTARMASADQSSETGEAAPEARLVANERESELECGRERASSLRPQDELWFVSSRSLGGGSSAEQLAQQLRVYRYDPASRQWEPASLTSFTQPNDTSLATTFYVHGNRVESNEIVGRGWTVYRSLVQDQVDIPAMRFVMWSWPAAQIRRPARDMRTKADRTEWEGYVFASVLAQMPEETPKGMICFSLGARIATGAMHLLGGGTISGRTLPESTGEDRLEHVSAVLYAAAVHSHWLAPGNYHEQALAGGGAILNCYNCCDPALKWYRFISRCSDPAALGYVGLAGQNRLPEEARYRQLGVANLVGCDHNLFDHLGNGEVMRHTRAALGLTRLTSAE